MKTTLREYALRHIWAEPHQDHQYMVKPNRLTRDLGARQTVNVMWEAINLPQPRDESTSYHVYAIGKLPPKFLTLSLPYRSWVKADEQAHIDQTVIEVTTDNGMNIPLQHCYLYYSDEHTLLLAIERSTVDLGVFDMVNPYGQTITTAVNLDNIGIYVRFYHNAFLQTHRWLNNPASVVLNHLSWVIDSESTFSTILASYQSLSPTQKKQTVWYLDGWVSNAPTTWNKNLLGRRLGFTIDGTIKKTVMKPLSSLVGFKSIKDYRHDKLLMIDTTNKTEIDYQDDIDFYLVGGTTNTFIGVRLNRMNPATIRQVTHNSWSINGDEINRLINANPKLTDQGDLYLLAVIRQGGNALSMSGRADRLDDLCLLNDDQYQQALAGVNSSVDFWTAAALENAPFNKVLSAKSNEMADQDIEDALGYWTIAKNIVKSQYQIPASKIVDLTSYYAESLYKDTVDHHPLTIWGYNEQGRLISYFTVDQPTDQLDLTNSYQNGVRTIEVIQGRLARTADPKGIYPDSAVVTDPLMTVYGCRHYVCNIVGQTLDYDWIDVTDQAYVSYTPATDTTPPIATWNYNLLAAANLYPCTKVASAVCVWEITFERTDARLKDAVEIALTTTDSGFYRNVCGLFGYVDVFLDGYPLIHGLDYIVNKTGTITVLKQIAEHINPTFIVRAYGYGDPQTNTVYPAKEIGFVKQGLISKDGVYRPHIDREERVIIGGFLRPSVAWAEKDPAANPLTEQQVFADPGLISTALDEFGTQVSSFSIEGKPYAIYDYHPIVDIMTTRPTTPLLQTALKRDQAVSEYLTPRLAETPTTLEYIAWDRWLLYSPILNYYISHWNNPNPLVNGQSDVNDLMIQDWEDDDQLLLMTKPIVNRFKHCDPAFGQWSDHYIEVDAVAYEKDYYLTAKQYATIKRLNDLLFGGRVRISTRIKLRQY